MSAVVATHLSPARVQGLELNSEMCEAAQTQRLRYQEFFDSAPDAYLLTDRYGIILDANYAAAELLTTQRAFLVGKPLGFFFEEGQRKAFYKRLMRPQGGLERWQSTVRPPRSAPRQVEITTAADLDGFRFILRDVTAARQAERLAAIGQVAAGLAHEGRNALQRIQACLSMLQMRLAGQPELLDLVARAQRAEDDLVHLFNEVRSFGAPIRLEIESCNLADIWRQAWAELGDVAARSQLREEIDGVDMRCQVSPFHLRQVFRNLMDNAVAAARGEVVVTIRCLAERLDGGSTLRVFVRDNGPGVPPEQRQHLFEPFHSTKMRGTGLGLAICKRLVEAHGGRIEMGNSASGGTELVITLPQSAVGRGIV